MCSFLVWKNACLNYREFDLEGDLVGVPHTWYLSAQSFIGLLKLVWREYDIVAMNEWKKKCVVLQRTWVSKRTGKTMRSQQQAILLPECCYRASKVFYWAPLRSTLTAYAPCMVTCALGHSDRYVPTASPVAPALTTPRRPNVTCFTQRKHLRRYIVARL